MKKTNTNGKSGNTWMRPELIILMRSHPEETVLENLCKHPGIAGPVYTQTCAANNAGSPCHASNNKS